MDEDHAAALANLMTWKAAVVEVQRDRIPSAKEE